jgi:hypothetical protein
MTILRSFPLLAIPVAIYNALAMGTGGFGTSSNIIAGSLKSPVSQIPMSASGGVWHLQTSDIILVIALAAFFFGVIGAARSANDVLLKHVLNMFLFILCLVEFLLLRSFATSTFFLITAMVLMETVAGFIITSVSARKDIEMAH